MDIVTASRSIGGNPEGKRSEKDFYPTPPEVTEALLQFLGLPPGTTIWEPAAGEGDMAKVFIKHGFSVIETDIQTGIDFLTADAPEPFDWIITNPPFCASEQFIKRCIDLNVYFALLLKSQYWHAAKRIDLFYKLPPAYVLPLTWRPDFLFKQNGRHGAPLMDVMWCVWDPLFPYASGKTEYYPLKKPKEE